VLRIEGLHVAYGLIEAVKGVDLEVGGNEIVTIVGANGAGKSTLLRTVAGLLRPRRGRILYGGRDVTALSASERVRRGLVLVPEGRAIFQRLTVAENLQLGAYTRGTPRASTLEFCLATFPALRQRWSMPAGLLSGGEQQMLAIARALLAEPRLLCLDEPSLGLAPLVVEAIFDVLGSLRERGLTLLLVEQNAQMALSLAGRAYVLETGRVTLHGAAADLLKDRRVREAYLGTLAEA
jgi:branched-chain amino acid transport system ATP-binding protein